MSSIFQNARYSRIYKIYKSENSNNDNESWAKRVIDSLHYYEWLKMDFIKPNKK